jgi:hypothetical protein
MPVIPPSSGTATSTGKQFPIDGTATFPSGCCSHETCS